MRFHHQVQVEQVIRYPALLASAPPPSAIETQTPNRKKCFQSTQKEISHRHVNLLKVEGGESSHRQSNTHPPSYM